ncbi:hypothetical protein X777_12832 [Ooceraea biroi]|uniref:Uncharacterized protein n=1 Tax=Ooceraea biroi TaxID=2015173 RepID=A0A026VYZ3_OOCBI|nr:hypothetical protein X777_12832 [Ooceraea biroi]
MNKVLVIEIVNREEQCRGRSRSRTQVKRSKVRLQRGRKIRHPKQILL